MFRQFITKQIKVPTTGFVNKKEPLNPEEYDSLCKKLEDLEEWQKLAYLKFSYSTGCRRAEVRQLLKEVVNYEPSVKMVSVKDAEGNDAKVESRSYKTHDTRCKGRGVGGSVRKLQFSEDAMVAIKKWLSVRGEDNCPFVFVHRVGSVVTQVSEGSLNKWCSDLFTELVGRRVHPHLFRESRATNLVVHEGKDIKTAQKLLSHASSVTTEIYVIKKDEDDADDAFI
jgi:integrase